jgi:hypothetical protein
MPGIGCGLPEMFILGLLYFFASLVAPFFLLQGRRRRDPFEDTFLIRVLFSISMFIWLLFRAIICIAPFDYSEHGYQIVFRVVSAILYLIPTSLAILILCELLFSYQDPGERKIVFFKVMFLIFLVAFVVIAIVVTVANIDDSPELTYSMALWRASTNFVVLLFFAFPVYQLFRTVLDPESGDIRKYDTIAQYGVSFLILVICVRIVYDGLVYAEKNPVHDYLEGAGEKDVSKPSGGVRAIQFLSGFFVEILTNLLVVLAVRVLRFVEQRFAHRRETIRERSNSSVIEWPLMASDLAN